MQVGKYWVTAEQKKTIEAKDLVFREGEWLTKDELAKLDAGQRKVGGVWKPILDADEAHRDTKDPWVLRGAYVELRSNVRYSKIVLGLQGGGRRRAGRRRRVSGIEPDVWGTARSAQRDAREGRRRPTRREGRSASPTGRDAVERRRVLRP